MFTFQCSTALATSCVERIPTNTRKLLTKCKERFQRHTSIACLAIAILHFPLSGGASQSQANLKPYSLDDYLSLASLRKGAGQGKRFVWERSPSYDQIGYYGFNHSGAWGQSGFQLQSIDLSSKNAIASPLFPPEPRTSYWFDSFSPKNRYVAFFASKEDNLFQGAYDTFEKRVHKFAAIPMLDWRGASEAVWVSQEEFVFSAYGPNQKPIAISRPYTGKKIASDSLSAWSGGLSVTTNSNALGTTDKKEWIPGSLYKANARTGKLQLLAEGRYQSPKVSSDGRYLAAVRQAMLSDQDPNKLNNAWLTSRFQLVVFDLQKNTSGVVVDQNIDSFPETLTWASDAPRLAFFGWKSGADARTGVYNVYEADKRVLKPWPHSGLELASERERGMSQKPERVVWLSGGLAVLARAHDGEGARFNYRDIARTRTPDQPGKADWFFFDEHGRRENMTSSFKVISAVPSYADANAMVVLADGKIWRLAPGRQPEQLAAQIEGQLRQPFEISASISHKAFDADAVFEVHEPQSTKFVLINFNTGAVKELLLPTANAEYMAASVESGAILFRNDHADGTDLILKYADGRQLVIDKLNQHLTRVAKTIWQSVSYKASSQGTERTVDGCLLLPPDYQPGRRYPMIVEVYPARSGASCKGATTDRFDALGRNPGPYSVHLLAAKGYVVFEPNTEAGLTRSNEGPIGAMPEMVSQGVDAMIEKGYADPKRIGLLGISQGGYSSLWVAAKSSRFKATVTINGWSDMYSHYFDTNFLHRYYRDLVRFNGNVSRYLVKAGSDFSIGRSPFEDPDTYVRNSPLFHAPKFSAPVLLIHSDMDYFAVQQYEHMFTALSIQGKPAKLLRYWGEGHSPSSPANIRHMWNEIFDWYDRYVMSAFE